MDTNAAEHTRFERLLDLWEAGLVNQIDDEWMREHATSCERCAKMVAVRHEEGAEYADEAPRRATSHLPPAMIASWERARLELRGLERRLVARHLERCAACRRELVFFGHEPALDPDAPAASTTPDPGIWIQRLANLASQLTELAVRQPLSVSVMRSTPADEVEAARLRGLEEYAAGAFDEATRHLDAAAKQSEDAETWLYLGSAHLLGGRAAEAVTALRRSLEREPGDPVAEEATWQLVNALLLVEAPSETVAHLDAIVARGGRRADEARTTRDRLRRAAEKR